MTIENPERAQMEADFKKAGLGLTPEQAKDERKRLGIGTTILAKAAGNKGLKESRVIELHDQYALQIYSEAYGDEELEALAKNYIAELPKAARKGQERDYIAACEHKLEAFRAALRDYNLSVNQGIIDANAQDRFVQGEVAADLRAAQTDQVIVQGDNRVIAQVNEHTDESNAAQTTQINANTNRQVNSAVGRINAHTDQVGAQVTKDVTQNTSAMLGVDAEGYTVKDADGNRVLANDNTIAHADSAVGQVNAHTDEVGEAVIAHTTEEVNRGIREVNEHTTTEHEKTRLQAQQQAVLDAKRQTISDLLMNEVNEAFPGAGHYRDSAVTWLGSSADRVMAATDLTFEEKKEALDELVRMVDEENVISDGDRATFEAKYFYRTEERPHI